MLTVTVLSKGRITIPKRIRECFGLRVGTTLALRVGGFDLVFRKVLSHDWGKMCGDYRGPSLNAGRKQERRKELIRDSKVVDSLVG